MSDDDNDDVLIDKRVVGYLDNNILACSGDRRNVNRSIVALVLNCFHLSDFG